MHNRTWGSNRRSIWGKALQSRSLLRPTQLGSTDVGLGQTGDGYFQSSMRQVSRIPTSTNCHPPRGTVDYLLMKLLPLRRGSILYFTLRCTSPGHRNPGDGCISSCVIMILNQLGPGHHRDPPARDTSTVPRMFDDRLHTGMLYSVADMMCERFADYFGIVFIERELLPVQATKG